ncbi:BrnT family toxin [Desulfothermus naphthae]
MDKKFKQLLLECTGFEWDEGNKDKNWIKHKVSNSECEQIFFNQPLIINFDEKHSDTETRFYALGHTDLNRKLFIVFTIRNKKIRVISARDMSKKERKIYEATI